MYSRHWLFFHAVAFRHWCICVSPPHVGHVVGRWLVELYFDELEVAWFFCVLFDYSTISVNRWIGEFGYSTNLMMFLSTFFHAFLCEVVKKSIAIFWWGCKRCNVLWYETLLRLLVRRSKEVNDALFSGPWTSLYSVVFLMIGPVWFLCYRPMIWEYVLVKWGVKAFISSVV